DRVVLGAGCVTTVAQAERCADAGSRFIVIPGLNFPMVRAMNTRGLDMIAGALTPTEVMSAAAEGADLIKILPCSALGGASYVRALRGPLPDLKLVPTGGVNMDTASDFIKAGACALGVGSDLVDISSLKEGKDEVVVK